MQESRNEIGSHICHKERDEDDDGKNSRRVKKEFFVVSRRRIVRLREAGRGNEAANHNKEDDNDTRNVEFNRTKGGYAKRWD